MSSVRASAGDGAPKRWAWPRLGRRGCVLCALVGLVQDAWGALKRWRQLTPRRFVHGLVSLCFLASAVGLLNQAFGIFERLDIVGLTWVSNAVARIRPLLAGFGPTPEAWVRDAAIVRIDDAHHDAHYLGTSPLDRCALYQDLDAIFAGRLIQEDGSASDPQAPGTSPPRTVVIDLGLAPPKRLGPSADAPSNCEALDSALKAAPPRSLEAERICQLHLNHLLDHAKGRNIQVVLIEPLECGLLESRCHPPEKEARTLDRLQVLGNWIEQRETAGVKFGRAELDVEHGIVLRSKPIAGLAADVGRFDRRLGAQVRAVAREPDGVPRLPDEGPLARMPGLSWLASDDAHPIDFRLLRSMRHKGQPITLVSDGKNARSMLRLPAEPARSDTCPASDTPTTVFVGSGYTEDDEFLTPTGRRSGVDVHAAIAARPALAGHPIQDFVLDLWIGLVLGRITLCHWSRYFVAREAELQGPTLLRPPATAYLWLVRLVLVFALCCVVFVGLSYALLSRGYWLSPLAMAAGVAFETFVVQGVEMSREARQEAEAQSPRATRPLPGGVSAAQAARRQARAMKALVLKALAGLPFVVRTLVVTVWLLKLTHDALA